MTDPTVGPVVIGPARADDHDAIVALWTGSGLTRSWNDPSSELGLKLTHDPEGMLVALLDDVVVGTVMVGFEGHRGWVNYLAVRSDDRHTGIGRALMEAAEGLLRRRGAPKVNLQVRHANAEVLAFYASLGYVDDEVVSLGKRLDGPDTDRVGPAEPGL